MSADIKLLHPRLIFQALVTILVKQSFNFIDITFHYGGDMNNITHEDKVFLKDVFLRFDEVNYTTNVVYKISVFILLFPHLTLLSS